LDSRELSAEPDVIRIVMRAAPSTPLDIVSSVIATEVPAIEGMPASEGSA
jgi:hypothetical protein